MSRNRVLSRHLPKDLNSAPIYVSPDASLSQWSPRLQSDLFDLAREFVHPGDTIWDIGANVGLFTIAAAQRAGPTGNVLAIEPDIWLAALLQRTAAAQRPNAAPIQIMQVAVSGATAQRPSTSPTATALPTISPQSPSTRRQAARAKPTKSTASPSTRSSNRLQIKPRHPAS